MERSAQTSVMHDFKYRELAEEAGIPAWLNMEDLRCDYLRPAVSAFLENIGRIISFCRMPAMTALLVQRTQLFTDAAMVATGVSLDPNDCELPFHKLSTDTRKAVEQITDRFVALSHEKIGQLFSDVGIKFIESNLETGQTLQTSMQAVLSSVVIESWTAFETLASDLWVVAIDNAPKELIERLIDFKKWQKPDEQITPALVYHSEHDPRKQFGSWLREVGKVSFQKLDYIRLYYSEAFEEEVNKLFDETEGGYIFALSAFRNALIHRSGKADRHFLKRVERFAEFRNIPLRSSLLIDGALVTKLRNVSILLGRDLVRFVDNAVTPKT